MGMHITTMRGCTTIQSARDVSQRDSHMECGGRVITRRYIQLLGRSERVCVVCDGLNAIDKQCCKGQLIEEVVRHLIDFH